MQLPQFHLGVAFSLGIPVAYAHIEQSVPLSIIWLMLANFCWIFAYDTAYAMVDRDDDIKTKVYSSAIWLGKHDVAGVAVAYFCMIMLLLTFGIITNVGFGFYFACLFALGMAYKFCKLVRTRQREACFTCFKQNHWLGMLIWLGIAADTGFTLT